MEIRRYFASKPNKTTSCALSPALRRNIMLYMLEKMKTVFCDRDVKLFLVFLQTETAEYNQCDRKFQDYPFMEYINVQT
jgi:hypothetical protein